MVGVLVAQALSLAAQLRSLPAQALQRCKNHVQLALHCGQPHCREALPDARGELQLQRQGVPWLSQ